MSLQQLLAECGGRDGGTEACIAGSDTEVCIAGSDTEACIGNDSPPVGSTSFPPQEHEAGDNSDHPTMELGLDSSPSAQSKHGSEGVGARPLREAAEERQAQETPVTPTKVAGGAAAPAPEASGPTPTAGRMEYTADAMAARLAVIPLEGKNVEEVAAAAVAACQEFGVEMRRFDSRKSSKEPGARMVLVGLACKHGMKNRQKEYLETEAANGIKRRKSSSQRTNCPCKFYVRWPVRGEKSEHPHLSMTGKCTLEHNHPVQKDAVDEVRRQNKRLDTPTKEACEALTDAGFKPAVQGKMLEALTGERHNLRAIQNAAAAHARRKTPYDANELLSKDRRLLYVEMLKKATAAVSAGVQTVPPEAMRAVVRTFERSMNTAAMISSGQGAVLGNPQAVRQPAVRSQGTREKSSSEYGGPASRRRAQNYNT